MLRIGVLGAAQIAPRALINPVKLRSDVEVVAVASRRAGLAAAFAEKHDIALAFDSYQAMLDEQRVDIIYNALPPSAHAEWTIAALRAGKHVLCEKPLATNAAEAALMVEVAALTGRVMMEAFHDRYHPLMRHLVDLLASARLGEIQSASATFQVDIPFSSGSIRHEPSLGGGAMMDLGCYGVHWLRTVFGVEPRVLSAKGRPNPLGADIEMSAILEFPNGSQGKLRADMSAGPMLASLNIEAANGTLEVVNPVLPHLGHSVVECLQGVRRQYTIGGETSYDYQMQMLVEAVTKGNPPLTGGVDSIANMQVIDAIYAAAGYDRATKRGCDGEGSAPITD